MRRTLQALAGAVAFAASAATGYAWSADGSTSPAGTGSTETVAHETSMARIASDFHDAPDQAARLLEYEAAVHQSMSARTDLQIRRAAERLLRSQDCLGILKPGGRMASAKDAVLSVHGAAASDPRWMRIVRVSSSTGSKDDGSPCAGDEAGWEATPRPAGAAAPRRRVYHVVLTPADAEDAVRRGILSARAVRATRT